MANVYADKRRLRIPQIDVADEEHVVDDVQMHTLCQFVEYFVEYAAARVRPTVFGWSSFVVANVVHRTPIALWIIHAAQRSTIPVKPA